MAATARTPATARVQLVLNVREEPQEQIVQVTTGHEVVEARRNGVPFLFKRKRSSAVPAEGAPPPPPPPLAPATSARTKSHLKTPAAAHLAQQAASTAAAAESEYVDELELPQALGQRLVEGMQALQERSTPADRLLALCSSLGTAAAEAATAQPAGAARGATLADAFAALQQQLANAVSKGSVHLASAPRPPAMLLEDSEVEQPDYQVDLQARKVGLRARLANFQKEEQEWQALLDKVEHLDQQQLAVVAGAGAAPSGEAPIAALEAEAGLVAGHPAVDELAALARLHAGVHRRLAMQVEGVCKLVGDVEEMVERANRGAQAVQAEYHAEKIRVFPHVDSPAWLIQELVRPGGKWPPASAQQLVADKENTVVAP